MPSLALSIRLSLKARLAMNSAIVKPIPASRPPPTSSLQSRPGVDAALFAFQSPLSKGALLADEVGLGKTIEAGLVLSQKWAERKRRIMLEPKASNQMEDPIVLAKKEAAINWCVNASDHAISNGGKPWRYVLIPHDEIASNITLSGFAERFGAAN